jgi:hypothetical protein
MKPFSAVFSSLVNKVRAINRKYAKPQVEMTWFVKACLLILRLYLFVLVSLMIYKFVKTLKS